MEYGDSWTSATESCWTAEVRPQDSSGTAAGNLWASAGEWRALEGSRWRVVVLLDERWTTARPVHRVCEARHLSACPGRSAAQSEYLTRRPRTSCLAPPGPTQARCPFSPSDAAGRRPARGAVTHEASPLTLINDRSAS